MSELTHEQIDALDGRDLEGAVRAAMAGEGGLRIDLFLHDTDAAVALLRETGWLATIKLWRGTVNVHLSKHVSLTRQVEYYASGDSVAEAIFRCWLKWKAGQP